MPRAVSSSRPSVLMMMTGSVGPRAVGAELGEKLQPVHVRHVDVEQDELDVGVLLQTIERLAAIERVDQRVLAQHHLIHLVHQLRIVDDEHFPWLHGALPEGIPEF